MTYTSTVQMVGSPSLSHRVAAAAAAAGAPHPDEWARDHMWQVAATESWREAWTHARTTQTINHNPDAGARTDVITDEMIASAVEQALG